MVRSVVCAFLLSAAVAGPVTAEPGFVIDSDGSRPARFFLSAVCAQDDPSISPEPYMRTGDYGPPDGSRVSGTPLPIFLGMHGDHTVLVMRVGDRDAIVGNADELSHIELAEGVRLEGHRTPGQFWKWRVELKVAPRPYPHFSGDRFDLEVATLRTIVDVFADGRSETPANRAVLRTMVFESPRTLGHDATPAPQVVKDLQRKYARPMVAAIEGAPAAQVEALKDINRAVISVIKNELAMERRMRRAGSAHRRAVLEAVLGLVRPISSRGALDDLSEHRPIGAE